MKKIIRITEKNGKQVVSARELHSFLGSKKAFADWIKHRVKKYGFIEEQDFITFQGESIGGRPSIEYAFPTDVARGLERQELLSFEHAFIKKPKK